VRKLLVTHDESPVVQLENTVEERGVGVQANEDKGARGLVITTLSAHNVFELDALELCLTHRL